MVIFEAGYQFTVEISEFRKELIVMFGDEYCVRAKDFYQLVEFFSTNPEMLEKWKRDSL